jgi:hypothetical protein
LEPQLLLPSHQYNAQHAHVQQVSSLLEDLQEDPLLEQVSEMLMQQEATLLELVLVMLNQPVAQQLELVSAMPKQPVATL